MALTQDELTMLREKARQARKDIVDVTAWSGGAHIGGALSVTDILIILYHKYLNIDSANPQWEDRDRVVLSKGHAGVGYAAVLARKGYFDFDLLKSFNKFKSPFGMHLDGLKVKGVDVSTGSLGHGLPIGVGLALGARLQKKNWYTYCILGDGECNEGSIWEAAMSAAKWKLDNLTVIMDRNNLQNDTYVDELMPIEPVADKWRAFGWHVLEIDGHDMDAVVQALESSKASKEGPTIIIAHTIKGKGVSYMENVCEWHGKAPSQDQARDALDEIRRCSSES